jgi:hypothetical protein
LRRLSSFESMMSCTWQRHTEAEKVIIWGRYCHHPYVLGAQVTGNDCCSQRSSRMRHPSALLGHSSHKQPNMRTWFALVCALKAVGMMWYSPLPS